MPAVMSRVALAAALMLISAAAAHAGPLTDPEGAALYVFDGDVGPASTCYDACAVEWPAYLARAGDPRAEDWTKAARMDGGFQWSYGHRPVYRGRAKGIGDNGDDLPSGWHVLMRIEKHAPGSGG